MPSKRTATKRHSAFEDIPGSPGGQPAGEAPGSIFNAARPEAVEANGAPILAAPRAPVVERIERLAPTQMIPDRFQPRRLLPTEIRLGFYSGQIDCYQAARLWLNLARRDPSVQAEVDRLLAMGDSFEEHGQIKPITGTWVASHSGEYVFQIETGERRFWAACLQHVQKGDKTEPSLRVEVVNRATRTRQVLENRHAEPPSAVGQACEIAALILDEIGEKPGEQVSDEFEYFRRANRRKPAGLWEKITPVMQLTRPRMEQLLDILSLPTPLLDLADRHRVPERVLREVLDTPPEQWEAVLKTSIQEGLTADGVAALGNNLAAKKQAGQKDRKRAKSTQDHATTALRSMIHFSSAMHNLDEIDQRAVIDELSDEFVALGQSELLSGILSEMSKQMVHKQNQRLRRR